MLKSMNEAMDYIESHLYDEIDYNELERITGTSVYHFRRMFSFLSGMTLGEYVRNRRLSNATFDLLHEGMSVTETAFKYGYESVDGFSRAFREWSGINPSEVKKKNMLKAFPKLSFQLTIQGGINMDYRIEKKEAYKIVGVKKRVPIQFEGENQEIIKLAKSITPEQRKKLHSYANMEPNQVVNASYNLEEGCMEEKGSLDHMIGFLTTKELDFDGFEVVEVPALTWAIFSSKGEFPKIMQETWAKIASEWLPASDYELVDAPNISFTGDLSDRNNVYSEIWFAVKKKGEK
ncbi:AraC family transcriptional regulator [Cytobacillus oceanisediminis]|uniref:AraC family transcriptional regulator n=1 Tax=Niallia alba TaxID=2729105 RepID=A0A7Y0K613_9BACI|nr:MULTISPECIES: AraC family transcriptional regulator [Bacillaceae]EOR23978.1 putative AraC-related transcriptional regulator [Niallia nealsonii AAU1]MBZ9536538.1 AraC family transcriptional regulator [Cytobacillus oceanisediminis]NMO76331.1 AraC family transcriptional regulator [Niallia alba]UTI44052.1 AraC family transcriptional regulator [Niallia sp. RD1]